MRRILMKASAGFAAACLFMSGCGSRGDMENVAVPSDVIRQMMTERLETAEVSFSDRKLDKDEVTGIVEEMIQGALYESADPKGGDYLRFQCGG